MTLTEILDELDIRYIEADSGHHHSREGWLQSDCPFCSPDSNRWLLGINLAYGFANCWQCGRHSLYETLRESANVPTYTIRELLGDLERIPGARKERIKGTLRLPKGIMPIQKAHRDYLRSRHLDPDKIEKLWNIQGIGIAAELAWRLFIPIHYQGDMVSWTTRSISDKHKTRYRSAKLTEEKLPHKSLLYGEDYCRHSIVVVEGPIDAWSIGPGCTATCGTGLAGNSQLSKIAKYPVRAICFDSEPTAQHRALQLVRELEPFPGRTVNLTLDSGKDANECLQTSEGRREIRRIQRMFLT
jgi:hypothetical protein